MGETGLEKAIRLGLLHPDTKFGDLRNGTAMPGLGPKKVTAIPKSNQGNVDLVKTYAPLLARKYRIATNYLFLDAHPAIKQGLMEQFGEEVLDWEADIFLLDYDIHVELHGGVNDRPNRGAHVREKGYLNDRIKMMATILCGNLPVEIPGQRIGPWLLPWIELFVNLREQERAA